MGCTCQARSVLYIPGCGDLDLGFNQPGFQTSWANEFDKSIWETYEKNYPETVLDRRDISSIPSDDIPVGFSSIVSIPRRTASRIVHFDLA